MNHCHMQVIPKGKHKGELVDEPEYEGWSGAGWAIGCTDPTAVAWLNTRIDRACVGGNEVGWAGGGGVELHRDGIRELRAPDGGDPARLQPSLRDRDRRGIPVQALRLHSDGRAGQRAGGRRAEAHG